MARKVGGSRAAAGFYWNPRGWEIVTVPKEGAVLPGNDEVRYIRLPAALMLLMAPAMGGLFVLFLPFIGFAMLARHAGRAGVEVGREAAERLAHTLAPAWRPGEAHLAGKRSKRSRSRGGASEELDEVRKQIETKRRSS